LATGSPRRLGIGFVGAGFMNRFHVQSLVGVRDCEAAGVFSPTRAHAESLAGLARALRVGEPRVHASLADLAADPAVDALWIATPNDLRVEIVEEIVELVRSGRARLVGLACEKPLARNLAERSACWPSSSRRRCCTAISRTRSLEPSIVRGKEIIWRRAVPLAGRPYLARAAEEHGGPHDAVVLAGRPPGRRRPVRHDMPQLRGRALPADEPGEPRESLRVEEVNAQIASLKWTRPDYVEVLRERSNGAGGRLPADAGRGLRAGDGQAATSPGRRGADRRGNDVVEPMSGPALRINSSSCSGRNTPWSSATL
jgi:hypothetical protein